MYSKEQSQHDGSFEYPKQVLMNKRIPFSFYAQIFVSYKWFCCGIWRIPIMGIISKGEALNCRQTGVLTCFKDRKTTDVHFCSICLAAWFN